MCYSSHLRQKTREERNQDTIKNTDTKQSTIKKSRLLKENLNEPLVNFTYNKHHCNYLHIAALSKKKNKIRIISRFITQNLMQNI